MNPEIEQALGQIHRRDARAFLQRPKGEDEFVAGAARRIGQGKARGFQALRQVVGV